MPASLGLSRGGGFAPTLRPPRAPVPALRAPAPARPASAQAQDGGAWPSGQPRRELVEATPPSMRKAYTPDRTSRSLRKGAAPLPSAWVRRPNVKTKYELAGRGGKILRPENVTIQTVYSKMRSGSGHPQARDAAEGDEEDDVWDTRYARSAVVCDLPLYFREREIAFELSSSPYPKTWNAGRYGGSIAQVHWDTGPAWEDRPVKLHIWYHEGSEPSPYGLNNDRVASRLHVSAQFHCPSKSRVFTLDGYAERGGATSEVESNVAGYDMDAPPTWPTPRGSGDAFTHEDIAHGPKGQGPPLNAYLTVRDSTGDLAELWKYGLGEKLDRITITLESEARLDRPIYTRPYLGQLPDARLREMCQWLEKPRGGEGGEGGEHPAVEWANLPRQEVIDRIAARYGHTHGWDSWAPFPEA